MTISRAVVLLFVAASPAGCSGDADDPAGPSAAIYQTMAEHEWNLLDPDNPGGTQMAPLWGDPASGAYGALLRFPAGFVSPMHSHSVDEYTITVQGTALHWTEDESPADAVRMDLGSFTFIPGGVNHVSSCAADGPECIAVITQRDQFDFALAP